MSLSENDFCVIGLGKFGISVAQTLEELGKVTLAIDKKFISYFNSTFKWHK